MNILIKVLGQRRGITKVKKSDGSYGYINSLFGVPGERRGVPEGAVRQTGHEFQRLHTEFHR